MTTWRSSMYSSLSLKHLKGRRLALFFAASTALWIWVTLDWRINQQAAQDGQRIELANVLRVTEDHISRTLEQVDALLLLQKTYVSNSRDPGLLVPPPDALRGLVVQFAWIGADGFLISSTASPHDPPRLSLSDRDHFRVHQNAEIGGLYISKPVLGRVSQKWSVQLSRRLLDRDGGFAGVVVASLNAEYISQMLSKLDLPRGSFMRLTGRDGVVRASSDQRRAALGEIEDRSWLQDAFSISSGKVESKPVEVKYGSGMHIAAPVGLHPLLISLELPVEGLVSTGFLSPLAMASAIQMLLVFAVNLAATREKLIRNANWLLMLSKRRAERKSALLQHTLDNMGQGLLVVDPFDRVAVCSRRLLELFEQPLNANPTGQRVETVFRALSRCGEFDKVAFARYGDERAAFYLNDAHAVPAVYERERPNGAIIEVRTNKLDGGWWVRTFTDVTHRRTFERRLQTLADSDALTGLANRRYLKHFIDRLRQQAAMCYAILCLDLDRFKAINDSHGHAIGDELLKAVGVRLNRHVRRSDLVARTGGDEFVVVLVGIRSDDEVRRKAQTLLKILSSPYSVGDLLLTVGVSIGATFIDSTATVPPDLLQLADIALYDAKAGGRNQVVLFSPELKVAIDRRRALELRMTHGLATGAFSLSYQPIVSIGADLQVVGQEALLRWHDADFGHVSPAEFIPIAEETGAIIQIGSWVLDQACQAVRESSGYVAVNVSAVQFRDGTLLRSIRRALGSSGLPPGRLVIEVTESVLIDGSSNARATFSALRDMGVILALDDFGTGYSSLSYLRNYQFDLLKIDRSFVSTVPEDSRAVAMLASIISMAKALGMRTVGEGVETEDQLDCLRHLGCDYAQGYYLGRPGPLTQGLRELRKSPAG